MHNIPSVRKAVMQDAVFLAKNMKEMDKLECKYSHDDTPLDALLSCFSQKDAENYSIVDTNGYVYGMFGVNSDPELENYGVQFNEEKKEYLGYNPDDLN